MTIKNGKICDNCVHHELTIDVIGFCSKHRVQTWFSTWCKDFERREEAKQ